MKKTIKLILTVMAVGLCFFFLRDLPFAGILGKSMEPGLKVGDLIIIQQTPISEIKEGDIIVFRIPSLVRERYNYPPLIAHRVVQITQRDQELILKTKGDNIGEDPFIVRPIDVEGKVAKKIPYAGFFLLFLQSRQGMLTIAAILLLIGLATYGPELKQIRHKFQREIFSPVLEEQKKTTQAMDNFSSAIAEYAKHLQSHTEVMKNLAETTKELKNVVEKLDKKIN